MAELFRKAALDKVSSPDQLDKQIKLISPSFWIAILGGGLIIVVALVWSIFGRLPVNVQANGMFMGGSNIRNVIAEADGIVENVYVRDGDEVSRGQEIAGLDDKVYTDALNELLERKENVEAVTFWSEDDPATADTKALIDIKSQADVADISLTADEKALKERYRALSKQKKAVSKAKSKRDDALDDYKDAQSAYTQAKSEYDSANEQFTAANILYQNKLKTVGPNPTEEDKEELARLGEAVTAAQTVLDTAAAKLQSAETTAKQAESAYSQAEQKYNTELSTKKQLEDTVSQYEAKVSGDSSGESKQMSSLRKQFEAAKGSILDQLDQEINKQQKSADAMHLKSRINGKVSGLNIKAGNAVQTGMVICKVTSDGDSEAVTLYVPVGEGKKIKSGMKVVVYPSTVNRQEYGHMDGVVTGVSGNVVSSEEMMNELGDQSLVQAFQQTGPVIKVTCSIEKDETTASGYKWSSRKGADVTLDAGTVVSADIITEEKAPITMLIPLLKEKLSVQRGDNNDQSQEGGN